MVLYSRFDERFLSSSRTKRFTLFALFTSFTLLTLFALPPDCTMASLEDKIANAMNYYMDSEDTPTTSTNAPPPAPVPSSTKTKQTNPQNKNTVATLATLAPTKKRSKLVRPTAATNLITTPTPAPRAHSPTKSSSSPREIPLPKSHEYTPPTYLRASPTSSTSTSKRSATPNLGATISPDKTTVAGSRLYARAKQQAASLAQKRADKPWKCTFEPQFATSATSRGSTPRAQGEFAADNSESASGQERFECLYRNASSIRDKQERVAVASKSNPKECTFKPSLTAKQLSNSESLGGQKRMEQLYADAQRMKAKVQMIKSTARKSENLFSPSITKKGNAVSQYREKDFAERLYRDERQIKAQYSKLDARKAENEAVGCTFQPTIKRSRSAPKTRPAWQEEQGVKPHERLYGAANKSSARRAVMVEEAAAQLKRETPFKPNLSASMQGREYGTPKGQSQSGFFERLSQRGGAQEKTAKREALLREERKQYTFTPRIPKKRSASAPKTRRGWESGEGGESPAFLRLYESRHKQDEERMTTKEQVRSPRHSCLPYRTLT